MTLLVIIGSGKKIQEWDLGFSLLYSIKLLKPCPTDAPVKLIAKVVESSDEKAIIHAELIAEDKVCANCEGFFVAVNEGHPAYNRW